MTAASGQGAADEVWRWEGNGRSLVYIHSTRIEELVPAHRHAAMIAPCDAVMQKNYWLFRNRAIANVISNGTSMEHCLLYEQSSFEKKDIAVEVAIVTETVGAARPNNWWHVFGNAKYQSALKERQARARAESYQNETVESAVGSGGRVLDQPVSFLKGPTAWKLRAEFSQDYAQLAEKNWYGNLFRGGTGVKPEARAPRAGWFRLSLAATARRGWGDQEVLKQMKKKSPRVKINKRHRFVRRVVTTPPGCEQTG